MSPKRWFRKKLQMQGAQKLRSEAYFQVRCNDEVEAQRRRWTFYETIKIEKIISGGQTGVDRAALNAARE